MVRARDELNRLATSTAQAASRQAARVGERARAASEASKQYVRAHRQFVDAGVSAAEKVLPEVAARRLAEAVRRVTGPVANGGPPKNGG